MIYQGDATHMAKAAFLFLRLALGLGLYSIKPRGFIRRSICVFVSKMVARPGRLVAGSSVAYLSTKSMLPTSESDGTK